MTGLAVVPDAPETKQIPDPYAAGYKAVDLPRAEILLRTGTWRALAKAARAGADELPDVHKSLALRAAAEIELRAQAAETCWQDDVARGLRPDGAAL